MSDSALKTIKKHVSKVGMVLTLVAAAIILVFAIREVKTAHTLIGVPLEQYKRGGSTLGSRRADVQLTAEQFNPATATFAGSVRVSISPNRVRDSEGNITFPAGEPEQTQAIESVTLSLGHAEKVDNDTAIVEQGGSEEIELKRAPVGPDVNGVGKFTWKAQRLRPSFWYPFDSYLRLCCTNRELQSCVTD